MTKLNVIDGTERFAKPQARVCPDCRHFHPKTDWPYGHLKWSLTKRFPFIRAERVAGPDSYAFAICAAFQGYASVARKFDCHGDYFSPREPAE